LDTDRPSGARQIRELAEDIARTMQANPGVYATAAARDTALPNPTAGMLVYIVSLQQFQVYEGGWQPIVGRQLVSPLTLNATWFQDFGSGFAPPSVVRTGRLIHIGGALKNYTTNAFPSNGAMANVPAGWAPPGIVTTWAVGDSNTHYRINITAEGQLLGQGAQIPAGTWFAIDVTYLAAS
jgi:hypothetical protein